MKKNQKNREFYAKNKNRQAAEGNYRQSSPSPPLISCGKREMKVLSYMFYNSHKDFNRSKYCRDFNEAPSTIRSVIVRLIGKGLLTQPNNGVYEVTENGKKLVSVTRQGQKRGVETSRQGVSTGANLSMHQVKFKMPITCRKNFDKNRLK